MHCNPVHILVLTCLSGLLGCSQAGRWEWQPRSDQAQLQAKEEVIWDCEVRAAEERDDILLRDLLNARPYGGWGDFGFEFCMEQKGWTLVFDRLP